MAPRLLQAYWANAAAGYLPRFSQPADLDASSCRTHKENVRVSHRGAAGGWLLACTPGGYVLHI
eukprot:3710364-Alexandrium_andersonii.AAC.1